MADIVVHASRAGRILCGAKPDNVEAFYAQPLHRGTDHVTCVECLRIVEGAPLAAVTSTCPICGNESPAGIETANVCDACWSRASVAFSMSAAGPESHAEFGATMDVAMVAAAAARVKLRKMLRRERVTRLWQAFQWFCLASSLMARSVRCGVAAAWTNAQWPRALELGDGSSSGP